MKLNEFINKRLQKERKKENVVIKNINVELAVIAVKSTHFTSF